MRRVLTAARDVYALSGRLLPLVVVLSLALGGCVIKPVHLQPDVYGIVYNPLPDRVTGERDLPWEGGTLRLTPLRQDPNTKQWVETGVPPREATVDEQGRYVLEKVPVGMYRVEFFGPEGKRYLETMDRIYVAPRTNHRLEKNIAVPNRVTIRIEGEALQNRQVSGPGWPAGRPGFMDDPVGPHPDSDTGPWFGIQDLSWWQPADQPPLSGGWHALLWAGVIGSVGEGTFTLPDDAGTLTYNVNYVSLGADDFGVVRLSIDGVVMGEFNTYNQGFKTYVFENIGQIELGPGEHVVQLEVVGPPYEGYEGSINVAIDYVDFVQAD
ncbi:MAG: hypothetical protein GX161_04060 [Firmicutes bacterium]|nr:hypothetical protein [Bacillota bacterium]